jgi:5'-nucleotidase (lipoprotein e(P4) family)
MLKNKEFLMALLIIILNSCNIPSNIQKKYSDYLVQPVLWYQKSDEMKALYFQAYNLARWRVEEYLKTANPNQKKAIIVDVDETVLDNSKYETRLIQSDSLYSQNSWKQWSNEAVADTLPGALSFLNYAQSKDIEIFYISNRKTDETNATIQNLTKFNFPNADKFHLLFKADKSSKEERRKWVAEKYDIILLCGDNLADFSSLFDDRKSSEFQKNVIENQHEFGNRFIVLPNPMYGDWEKTIYNNSHYTANQRDSLRRANLK